MDNYSAYIEGKLQAWLDMKSLVQVRIDGLQKQRMKVLEAQAAPPAETTYGPFGSKEAYKTYTAVVNAPTPAPETAPTPAGATCVHNWSNGPSLHRFCLKPKCVAWLIGGTVYLPEISAQTTARPSTRDQG